MLMMGKAIPETLPTQGVRRQANSLFPAGHSRSHLSTCMLCAAILEPLVGMYRCGSHGSGAFEPAAMRPQTQRRIRNKENPLAVIAVESVLQLAGIVALE